MYESIDAYLLQAEGNSIIDFKPSEEQELTKEIQEETRKLASSYLELRDSIISFRANRSGQVEQLKREIEKSKDPLEFRNINASLIHASKREIVQNALEIVCNNLNAQTAALFLISKSGILERVGIYGAGKSGEPILSVSDWFEEESYAVGDSFTGRAAKPKKDSKYGEIQYTESLDNEILNPQSREKYIEKLGALRCSIAIPLNGRNRTYGVLRIINKIENPVSRLESGSMSVPKLSETPFSKNDVRQLLFLSAYIANALSNFRRDVQGDIFKYLSHLLIRPTYYDSNSLKKVFGKVIDLLVQNPETAFKAGILRLRNDASDLLEVQAVSLASGVSENRDNTSRKSDDPGFLWLVVENRKRLIFQDIQGGEELSKFKNRQWIEQNSFQASGCFPLLAKNEVIGTLSLYTGYNYEFYPDSVDFLQAVADLIASFVLKVKLEEQERNLQKNLESGSTATNQFLWNPETRLRFISLAEEWKRSTKSIPSLTQKLMHPAYQQIIGLGAPAVPLILKELTQNPDHWFWALKAITGEDPVDKEQAGRFEQMTQAWLEWGRKRNYVLD